MGNFPRRATIFISALSTLGGPSIQLQLQTSPTQWNHLLLLFHLDMENEEAENCLLADDASYNKCCSHFEKENEAANTCMHRICDTLWAQQPRNVVVSGWASLSLPVISPPVVCIVSWIVTRITCHVMKHCRRPCYSLFSRFLLPLTFTPIGKCVKAY